jgi:hypothetical protein
MFPVVSGLGANVAGPKRQILSTSTGSMNML